ncbi:MAG: hypothetical protein DWH91_01780 [Planctomycetota bacterium]|nr:MAG: hypothetical protein DWH91_01780 [Planctomycetota bacterium]
MRAMIRRLIVAGIVAGPLVANELPPVQKPEPAVKPQKTQLDSPSKDADDSSMEEAALNIRPAETNPAQQELEAAAAAMDRAASALEAEQPDAIALREQQEAIDRLRTLLKAASQKTSKSPRSSQLPPEKTPKESTSDEPGERIGGEPQERGGRRSENSQASESTENIAGPQGGADGVLPAGVRATAVWGHLPQREQEAVMRTLTESLLPEYATQIQDYYRALAEEK